MKAEAEGHKGAPAADGKTGVENFRPVCRSCRIMALALPLLTVTALGGFPSSASAQIDPLQPGVQALVFVRHAEKPRDGLGLLTCQGLNRSLMLPDWFEANLPKPDHIFAPNPSVKATEISGDGYRYDYVRPLLTIGPTAIKLGVPINTQIPYNDPGLLLDTLLEPEYRDKLTIIAWEHNFIAASALALNRRLSGDEEIPMWAEDDFGSVFIFTIDWDATPVSLQFSIMQQDFGAIEVDCPQ